MAKQRTKSARYVHIAAGLAAMSSVIFAGVPFLINTFGTAHVDLEGSNGPCPVVGPGPCGESPVVPALAPHGFLTMLLVGLLYILVALTVFFLIAALVSKYKSR